MSDQGDREKLQSWLFPLPWQLGEKEEAEGGGDLVRRVLLARGLDGPDQRRDLFDLTLEDIPDPFLFRDMDRACRILEKLLDGEDPRILIFGDYDADGLTAAALLARYFLGRGLHPLILIPDRFDDGYGLSEGLVEEISLHRPDLVITVDTGTSSPHAIRQLLEEGIGVIVTDHHLATDAYQATGVPLINPSLPHEHYPCKDLSGAGVAYLLTLALDRRLGPSDPVLADRLVSLAAVGTVADVVPLTGVNRIIVRRGLEVFRDRAPEGLRAIGRKAGLAEAGPSSRDIAFSLAPRLNAAGRMGDVRLALDLLMEDDPAKADRLAARLDDLNLQRRQTEQEVYRQALAGVLKEGGGPPRVLALARGKGWHAGVLGIVSSRLVERFRVPAMTLNEEGGVLTGSARSFGTLDLIEAINAGGDLLEKYGGHAGAAGLTLKTEKLIPFKERLTAYLEALPQADRQKAQQADIKLTGSDLDLDRIRCFDRFEPTGAGFERPVVWMDNLTLEGINLVGEGRHLKLVLRTPDPSMRLVEGLYFGRSDEGAFYRIGDLVDVLAIPEINNWRDRESVQLRLVDLRPAGQDRLNREGVRDYEVWLEAAKRGEGPPDGRIMAFSQTLFSSLWQLVSTLSGPGRQKIHFLPARLAWFHSHRYNVEAGAVDLLLALKIFEEIGLLDLHRDQGEAFAFRSRPQEGQKPALSDSPLWETLEAWGTLKL